MFVSKSQYASWKFDFLQITCLYDMDIVFQPNGNFDEVYLYVSDYDPWETLPLNTKQEELMEADLHAIVSSNVI